VKRRRTWSFARQFGCARCDHEAVINLSGGPVPLVFASPGVAGRVTRALQTKSATVAGAFSRQDTACPLPRVRLKANRDFVFAAREILCSR